MQAVITVVGCDKVGILAKISALCAQVQVNIEEVTQSILQGTFAMIMIASLPDNGISFGELVTLLQNGGEEIGVQVTLTRQETYDAMHKI